MLGEHAGLIAAHLMLGTILWGDDGDRRERAAARLGRRPADPARRHRTGGDGLMRLS